MLHRLQAWSQGWQLPLARALLPSSCALCGARCDSAVCMPCQRHYMGARTMRCVRCANRLDEAEPGHTCGSCLAQRPAFDATLVAADYAAPIDQLVLQLKFGGRLALAPWCAHMLVDAVLARRDFMLPNVLCPVPLGAQRLLERGFNQALEIAKPLAKSLGVPLWPRLAVRALETRAQSSVAPSERKANIRNAFIVAPELLAMVRGQHIGVVDDVMTSGQTLSELAATFKRFGAARVSNLVFARTPQP